MGDHGRYSGTMLSTDTVAQGPELSTERRWLRLRLGVTLLQQLPLAVTRGDVDMRLLSSGIRFVAGFPTAITSHLSASFGLGAGVDATRVTPRGNGAQPAFWRRIPCSLPWPRLSMLWGLQSCPCALALTWIFWPRGTWSPVLMRQVCCGHPGVGGLLPPCVSGSRSRSLRLGEQR